MFYFILCILPLIVFCFKCYLTGFDKINHYVHLECMSIVTDATQNQNGADLTLNWGVEIIVDLTLIGESNLSWTSIIKLESHKSRKPIAASDYEIYTLYKFHKSSSGQERTNEIWIFPRWIKARTLCGI